MHDLTCCQTHTVIINNFMYVFSSRCVLGDDSPQEGNGIGSAGACPFTVGPYEEEYGKICLKLCNRFVYRETLLPANHTFGSTFMLLHIPFGHVMRTNGSLERDIMIGQVDGCRRQGRPCLRWMDSIKENTGFGLEKLKEIVKDINKWRRLVEEKTRNRERTNIKR